MHYCCTSCPGRLEYHICGEATNGTTSSSGSFIVPAGSKITKEDLELAYQPGACMPIDYKDVQYIPPIEEGVKHDQDKVPVELLPTQALEEIAKVLAFGKIKYEAWNWSKGFKWTRLIGAAMRHLFAWQRGEDKDKESGLSHLAHLGCCVLFLLQHELSGLGEDDRYKEFVNEEKDTKKD
jgi:hypothetical protein